MPLIENLFVFWKQYNWRKLMPDNLSNSTENSVPLSGWDILVGHNSTQSTVGNSGPVSFITGASTSIADRFAMAQEFLEQGMITGTDSYIRILNNSSSPTKSSWEIPPHYFPVENIISSFPSLLPKDLYVIALEALRLMNEKELLLLAKEDSCL